MTDIIKLKKEEIKVYTFYATVPLAGNQGSATYKVSIPSKIGSNQSMGYNLIADGQPHNPYTLEVEGFELAQAHAKVIKSILNHYVIEMHEQVKEVQKYKVD